MNATLNGERTLTELDHARLARLGLRIGAMPGATQLDELLSGSDIIAPRAVPSDVVTMYTQVEIEDCHSRQRHKLVLCYPADAEPAAGFISVLSPVGLALIGMREGATVRWMTPSGEEGSALVVSILFQPEASGDYTL